MAIEPRLWLPRPGSSTSAPPARRSSLRVEALEERQCLSVAAPAGLTLSVVSPYQVNLAWHGQVGASSYQLFRWDNGKQTSIVLPGGTTSYAATGLAPGHKVWFDLFVSDGPTSVSSGWQPVQMPAEPIAAPVGLQAHALSSTQIALAWQPASGATGYRVYQWNGTDSTQIADLDAGTTQLTVPSLTPGQTYYFYVQAYNASNAANTTWASAQTVPAPIAAPMNLSLQAASSTEIDLAWGAGTGATGYRVYEWNGSRAVPVATLSAGTTSYAAQGLAPGTSYWFFVQSFNASNTAQTDWKTAVTPLASPLTAPVLTVQQIGGGTAALSWTAASEAAGYRVYQYLNAHWALVQTVAAGTTHAVVSGLSTTANTWFVIQAYATNDQAYANSDAILFQFATTNQSHA